MPILPPIGPLGAPLPPLPGIPLPGIPRPDFGALFDRQSTAEPPSGASGAQPAPLMPPARSLNVPLLGPEAAADPRASIGPRAQGTGLGIEPVFESIGNYLGSVNRLVHDADAQQRDLAMGKNVELHDVMIATEKASVAVQLTMQVRNKLVESYQEVMRMQV